jgi:hypothetical protein
MALRRIGFALILLSPLPVMAQLAPLAEGGARAIALGRAAPALSGDVWALYNPASPAAIAEGSAALFVSQAFGMSELRVAAAAVAQPMRWGTTFVGARTFGFDDFRENVFGVGFARAFPVSPTRTVHAGLALRYTAVSIPEFVSTGVLGLSAGLLVEVMPGLHFGVQALNLNRPELSPHDPLESRMDAGLAFRATDAALIIAALSKDLDYPLSLQAGLEVQPVEVLFVRAGFSSEPSRLAGGFGLVAGRLRTDIAAEWHAVLGLTPALELSIRW